MSVHTFIYVHNALLYIYYVYVLCIHKTKSRLCHDHKINSSAAQCAIQYCTKHRAYTSYIRTFLKLVVSNHFGSTGATRTRKYGRVLRVVFIELISKFVFDILQNPNGCIQICCECIAPLCINWVSPCL